MAMTIEELDELYKGKEKDDYYLHMQAVLGSNADKQRAYDAGGNFRCINWFDCTYCPAFSSKHCL